MSRSMITGKRPRILHSLTGRLLVAGLTILIAFLGLTGWALDQAFRSSAEEAVKATLQARLYGLLGVMELDRRGRILMPENLADQQLEQPGSGHYAQIVAADGEVLWASPSTLGRELPSFAHQLGSGETRFKRTNNEAAPAYFELLFNVVWEYAPQHSRNLTVRLLESTAGYQNEVTRFRRSLVLWLSVVGGLLLLMQLLILVWGLRPLGRLSRDIERIQAGRAERLGGGYPRELTPLADTLNRFIQSERDQRARYRHALADLAHSLKTPLAVIRGSIRRGDTADAEEAAQTVRGQVDRMQSIIDYQLQRAATAGRTALRRPVALRPTVERVMESLRKVHAGSDILCECRIPGEVTLAVETDDLLELMGNLLENAYKWAHSRIQVSAVRAQDGLRVRIEDDGPGISQADRARILERGQRADEAAPGHGLGLAIVADIMAAYQGSIEIDTSPALGGARVSLLFPDNGPVHSA